MSQWHVGQNDVQGIEQNCNGTKGIYPSLFYSLFDLSIQSKAKQFILFLLSELWMSNDYSIPKIWYLGTFTLEESILLLPRVVIIYVSNACENRYL